MGSSETQRTGLGPDDMGLNAEQIFDLAKPVEPPASPYASPVPPSGPLDLPRTRDPFFGGAHYVRGDEAELSDTLHESFLGRYVVTVAGELWQYDPDRRGWWRVPEETAMTWVSRLAGARVYKGRKRDGTPRLGDLKISSAMARGAFRLASARCHWAEEKGDFWTGGALRGYTRGIAQFRDVAVVVTQTGPGVLSVEEVPPEPSHRVRASRVLPCRWPGVPDLADLPARCPELWAVHRDWWAHHGEPEAKRRLLTVLEFMGASVLGFAPTMAKALFLYGPGGTGKSTLIDLMTRWCQPSAICSVTPQDMGVNRFASARLDGAIMNVVDDLPADAIMDAGVWKSSITGGRIDIERKGRDGYGIYPQAGHLYAGNRLPTAVRANSGFWRRWLVVQYDRVFADTPSDMPVIDRLMGEMEHIVAFAVAAFLRTGGAGGRGYTEPACHADVMRQWDQVSDSVSAFREERLAGPDPGIPKAAWPKRATVYKGYRSWCLDTGRRPVSAHEWGTRIADMGLEVVKTGGIWRVGCIELDED